MLKRIFIAALMWPLLALAQSYPSPTYQNLTVLGTFTSSGNIGLPSLAAQAANTVVANATASSASPTAFVMPGCSSTGNALNWTTNTGFTCQTGLATLASPTFTGTVTTPALNSTGFYKQSADFTELRLRATSGANLNGWRIISGVNGASDGSFTIQHSTDNFASNFTNAAVYTNTGVATFTNGITNSPISGSTGAFTTLSASSAITPSSTSGIVGTTTNDNANAGSVGEFVNPAATSGTNLPTNTTTNCASTSFAAGDWDIQGIVSFVPAGSTVIANPSIGISTTSATFGSFDMNSTKIGTNAAGLGDVISTPVVRESFSTTTTVYLVATAGVVNSTATCSGRIRGRRPR